LKRILFLVLLLIVFTMPCAFAAAMTVHENNDYYLKFSHPSNWELSSFTRDNSFVITTHPFVKWNEVPVPIVEIQVTNYPIKNMDELIKEVQKEIHDDALKNEKLLGHITVEGPIVTHLKNIEAIFLRESMFPPYLDSQFVQEQYFVYRNSYRYVISTCGTPHDLNKNRQILKDILNSFEFLQ